jgi:hypothetical protein
MGGIIQSFALALECDPAEAGLEALRVTRPASRTAFESPVRQTRNAAMARDEFTKQNLADGEGFEPPVLFSTHAFQACTIDRSVTHP